MINQFPGKQLIFKQCYQQQLIIETNRQMTFEQKTIKLQNGQMINYVELNPNGKVDIIFIHGNFSAWIWWKDTLDVIQKNDQYHIIALDLRGFGKSSYKNPINRFNQHAEDLKYFIQLKGLKDVVLIGWSYGGGIAIKTAQIAPQLISKIIPTASISHTGLPFINGNGEKLTTKQQIMEMPKFAYSQNIRKTNDFPAQKKIFDLVLFTRTPNYPEQKRNQLIKCSFIQAEYPGILQALANPDINIEKVKAKALMIHGTDDIVIQPDSVKETGRLLGNCLEIWQNHAHMIPIEDPKRFVQRISEFINSK